MVKKIQTLLVLSTFLVVTVYASIACSTYSRAPETETPSSPTATPVQDITETVPANTSLYRYHDEKYGVTCWYRYNTGIHCISDNELASPSPSF